MSAALGATEQLGDATAESPGDRDPFELAIG